MSGVGGWGMLKKKKIKKWKDFQKARRTIPEGPLTLWKQI